MKILNLAIFIWLIVLAVIFSQNSEAYPLKTQIREIVNRFSIEKGLNPSLVSAIIEVESSWKPFAVGLDGEVGLMQLHPVFFPQAEFDYIKNIDLGTSYLRLVKELKGREYPKAWFVFYNYGPYSKLRYPKKTKYYKKVMCVYKRRRNKTTNKIC